MRPPVSQHLKVLKGAGLVSERRDGTRRMYSARPEGLAELRQFVEELWDVRLARLKREAELAAVCVETWKRKETTMGNPVVHFEIMGGDGEKLKGFYSDLFGWKIDSNNPMNYGMVETGGDGGINGGVGDGENFKGTRVYIAVPDLQEALDKVEAAGGKTVMPPTDLPQVTLALFEDPEGNSVGLVKG